MSESRRTTRDSEHYGKGVVELEPPSDPEQRAAELIKRVRATFDTPQYSPPVLPVAALEVHRLSQARNVKLDEVLATLEKDPLLAARVLRAANSSLYAGAPLQSLHHAVMRLGMKNLAGVVWEVAMNMRVFRCKAYGAPMEQIRRHSIAVAHLARVVAQATPIALDYAFLCGLLHDVGAAAILLMLGDGARSEGALPDDVLFSVLGAAHSYASQLIAKTWKLPSDLQLVLAHHHTVSIGGYSHPTAAVIALAEQLLVEEGPSVGMRPSCWDFTPPSSLHAAELALQIGEASLSSVRKRAVEVLSALAQAE